MVSDDDAVALELVPDKAEAVITYNFGGRLTSSEYIQIEDKNGKKVNVHKVHIDLMLDNPEYIALLSAMGRREKVTVTLV